MSITTKIWFINFACFMLLIVGYIVFENKKNNLVRFDDEMFDSSDIEIIRNYNNLNASEKRVFSRNNEDGVIEAIFDLLKIKNLEKYFVEITGPGIFQSF
jgi:hypothetical protein